MGSERLAPRRLLGRLEERYPICFARLSPRLVVEEHSADFGDALSEPSTTITGQPLSILIWEFAGSEPVLGEVLDGERERFTLRHVNREGPDGAPRYLNLHILPLNCETPGDGLLLIVRDVTSRGRLEQDLVQERNELALLRRELDHTHRELGRVGRFKSELLAVAAGNLHQLLDQIRAQISELASAVAAGEAAGERRALARMRERLDELHRLLDELVELESRERRRPLRGAPLFDLGVIFERHIDEQRWALRGGRSRITLDAPPQPLLIRGDAGWYALLAQLLLGLARSEGRGRDFHLRVVLRRAQEEAPERRISIRLRLDGRSPAGVRATSKRRNLRELLARQLVAEAGGEIFRSGSGRWAVLLPARFADESVEGDGGDVAPDRGSVDNNASE